MMKSWFYIILFSLYALPIASHAATPKQVYHVAIELAAHDKTKESIAALQAASALLPEQNLWKSRMLAAAILLTIKQQHQTSIPPSNNLNLNLARHFAAQHPLPPITHIWMPAILATLIPGAGHLWLGRPHDAWVACLMVVPIFLLTIWAWRRSMGPVTVFFALITLWLWSGTIFSAISLSERATMEAYLHWWQPLWQAAALSGQPW